MTTLKELIDIGTDMGLKGTSLAEFVRDEQARERDQRQHEREEARAEAERAHELLVLKENRQLEKEREERAIQEHLRKCELLSLQEKQSVRTDSLSQSLPSTRGPKLPSFDDERDSMDSYLQRFERFATTQKWDKATSWASNLSVLLKGRALDVFSRLPVDQSLDYEVLKTALLKRFEMTEEGFRNRFRSGRPEKGETFSQFAVRLDSYFTRWLELAKTNKTFDNLRDLMVRDQFLQACGQDLVLFLKERTPTSLSAMSQLADQYAEARGNPSNLVRPKGSGNKDFHGQGKKREDSSSSSAVSNSKEKSGDRASVRHCYVCNSTDHLANRCPKKKSGNRVALVRESLTKKRQSNILVRADSQDKDISVSCDVSCKPSTMPVVEGLVGNQLVTVLRDTGCGGVVLKRSLARPDQMTGESRTCTLADGSTLQVPIAMVEIDTPYYEGSVIAWCMETPVYDLIVGNIEGARPPGEPNYSWNRGRSSANAVQTRAQKREEGKPYKPLKVPEALGEVLPEDIKNAQQEDDSLTHIRELVRKGDVKERQDGGTSRFFLRRGIVYRKFSSPCIGNGRTYNQLVVPKKYRGTVMKLAHDTIMSGHLGAKRTLDRIMMEFYWPGVNADVTRFCRSCDVCQRTFPKGRVAKVPLGRMPLIDTPFKRVAIDLVGPLQPATARGNRFILTVVDYATRYPEAVALPGIETERVAEALVDIYSRVGIPREVLTDQGSQFTSDLMKEVSRLLSIRRFTTTPYHPMCNGLVERFNGTLKQMLKRMCAERPKDWDKYINSLLFAYREVPQESLGFSPFELLYGRTVRGPMMILRELWTKDVADDDVKTTYQYVVDLRERLEETCKLAQEQLSSAKVRQAKYYNRKAKVRTMEPGQRVLVLLPTKRNKLLMQWRGPFVITERKGSMDYAVNVDGKVKTLHANMLRLYVDRTDSGSLVMERDSGALSVVCASIVRDADNDEEDDFSPSNIVTLPTSVGTETVKDVDVSDELEQDVNELLSEFADVLTDVPGKTTLVEHDINLTTNDPVRVKSNTLPFQMKATIREEVDKMLKMGVIEPSDSPFASPVVIVRKKDGTNRFCIDFRRLNRVTVFDAEPMPNAEDIFSRLAGHQYFSRLDLSKGYWQVPMAECSKRKTAFTTPVGLFQFNVMPFGLVNAPATFCRLMRKLLHGMSNIESFIDDILIYTQTWEQHIDILRELFVRLRNASISARPSKCAIGYKSLECLGHMVGNERLLPNPEKVKAILEAPRPETKTQVRAFLGLAGFYRKFIANFAAISVPLTDLTRKGQPNKVVWELPQEAAFETLKRRLASKPILKLVDLEAEFILRTDASDKGLGAILLQEEDGNPLPVAFASRKLKASERAYAVIEKECLAVIWGITKFERYLYGRSFILETDHQPLVYLNKLKGTNARLMRWALILQPYRFTIRAIRGKDNVGADCLCRL
ncbi:uncharacterized protein [Argopecten irradians]|uniref:uncharacterized protein n=1 Tax=Argopecten irradians TaxID=31199 RepID=UPI0037141365